MTDHQQWHPMAAPHPTLDQALDKILSEIQAGLDHGFFDFAPTCETVNAGRRRLTLRAGKSHQFVIPREECVLPATPDTGAPPTHITETRTIVSMTRTRQTPLETERAVLDANGDRS
jgi:hypothetical protein